MLTEEQRESAAVSFRLTPALIKVFELLLEVPMATNKMIEACVDGNGTPAKLVIYRLRKMLKHTTINIQRRQMAGYWIDTATKAYVLKTINDNVRFVKKTPYIALQSNRDQANADSNLGDT